jgi:hypothetical protein
MGVRDEAVQLLIHARALVADLKTEADEVTVDDARLLYHHIREVEGWLLSARRLLDPSRAHTDG